MVSLARLGWNHGDGRNLQSLSGLHGLVQFKSFGQKCLGLTKPNCTRWVSTAKAMTAWLAWRIWSKLSFQSKWQQLDDAFGTQPRFQDRCSTLLTGSLAAVLVKGGQASAGEM
jgi:hypothetical protein